MTAIAESCEAVTNTTGGASGICQDLLQRFEAVEPRHVLIERDDVDAALRQAFEPLLAARGMHDVEAEPRQAAVDQPGQRRVVVDIQQRGRGDVMWRPAGPE